MLNFHRVWFVLGAAEPETPVCDRSWWNIGHESAVGCALEPSAPAKMVIAQTKIKNSATRVEQTVAFFLILLSPYSLAYAEIKAWAEP